MQNQICTRTCDNPDCQGTGDPYPKSVTVETVTDGTTNRPEINWIIGYNTNRSGDNTVLMPVGLPKQFCQPQCCIAFLQGLIDAAIAAMNPTP